MPRVPTRDTEQVRAAPLRTPLVPVSDVNVQGLASGIAQAGTAIERGQLQVEQIELQEADAALEKRWNDVLYNGDEAYYNRRGRSAYESRTEISDELAKIADEVSAERLSSGRQRQSFQESVTKRLERHRINVGRHAFDERQQWDVDSAVANTESWLTSVFNDPARMNEALVRIGENTGVIQEKKYGEPAGSKMSQQAQTTAASGVYLNAIMGEITRDLSSAQGIFDEHGEKMLPQDQLKARNALRIEGNRQGTVDKAFQEEVEDQVEAYADAVKTGNFPSDSQEIASLVSGAVAMGGSKADTIADKWKDANRFLEESVGFAAFSPDDQNAALTQLRNRIESGQGDAMDTQLLDQLESINKEHQRQIDRDPLQYYITHQRGGQAPSLSTIGGMRERAQLAKEATQFVFGDTEDKVLPFTDREFASLINTYDKGSRSEKNFLVSTMQSAFGGDAVDVFAEFNKKGAYSMGAVAAMTLDGAPEVGDMMLQGEEAIKQEPELLSPRPEFTANLNEMLGDAYQRGTQTRNTVEQAILNVYAGLAVQPTSGIEAGVYDDNTLEKAVDMVTGGIMEFRGRKMPVPVRGDTENDFEDWFDFELAPEDFEGVAGFSPEDALRHTRNSENGAMFFMVGPAQYRVGWLSPSGDFVGFKTMDGEDLVLNYTKHVPEPVDEPSPFAVRQ